eukprot:TRINITY_DN22392_c0_g1_i1.p1 TRINITY_DN22392_c0_g1~~TRINITY_DN22392_c0_g1_i1.p1  ORF type:complete len:358 (+),score=87.60 TRINITY_DN22392_c0_g1_i1:141-1214(+)
MGGQAAAEAGAKREEPEAAPDWLVSIRTAAVRDLEEIDDEYDRVLRAHEAERLDLKRKFEKRFAEVLRKRKEVIQEAEAWARSRAEAGLSVPGFWRIALQNAAEFQEDIEKHDECVLDCLRHVDSEWLDDADRDLGFRIRFDFEPNPYFSNTSLEKVYHTERKNKYVNRLECVRIEATKISWYAGKNVTVELVSKKPVGRRRRQVKVRKEEVSRPSFFRTFFRNLGPDEEFPEDEWDDDADEERCSHMMECLIDEDYDQGLALRERIIPHAVRWYSGEAREGRNDEADGEGEEEEEEDAGDHAGSDRGGDEGEETEEEDDEDVSASDPEDRGHGATSASSSMAPAAAGRRRRRGSWK